LKLRLGFTVPAAFRNQGFINKNGKAGEYSPALPFLLLSLGRELKREFILD